MLSIIETNSYPDKLRLHMIKLLKNLYLDVEKFQPIEVPSETAIWGEIPPLASEGQQLIDEIDQSKFEYVVKMSKVRVPSSFEKLKTFCQEFLSKTKGIIYVNQIEKNGLILAVMDAVNYMVNHGFYANQ